MKLKYLLLVVSTFVLPLGTLYGQGNSGNEPPTTPPGMSATAPGLTGVTPGGGACTAPGHQEDPEDHVDFQGLGVGHVQCDVSPN